MTVLSLSRCLSCQEAECSKTIRYLLQVHRRQRAGRYVARRCHLCTALLQNPISSACYGGDNGKNFRLCSGILPSAIPLRSCTVSGKRSSGGAPSQLVPRVHLKDILKEWHSGRAGRPFIYPADPACRPDHIASSSLLALPLRHRGSRE